MYYDGSYVRLKLNMVVFQLFINKMDPCLYHFSKKLVLFINI